MGISAQSPGTEVHEQAAELGRGLLAGDGDALSGNEDFLLMGMDVIGDIGTVWLALGDWSFRCDYEQDTAGVWHHLGGGSGSVIPELVGARPSAASSGTPLLAAPGGIGFSRSRRDHRREGLSTPTPSLDAFGFVASFCLRAADIVDRVAVEGRDIPVPDHGRLVVAWKAAPSRFGPIARPPVVAFDAQGRRVAALEPLSPFDDVTMQALTELGAGQD